MFTDFISKLDISDPRAKTPFQELWEAWLAQAAGPDARIARRRDFEAAVRSQFPLGLIGPVKYVGGCVLPGTQKRRWFVTDAGALSQLQSR